MASAKTARSRGTPVKENGPKLEEGLNVFKSDKFDAQTFVQSRCSLNEKVFEQLSWSSVCFMRTCGKNEVGANSVVEILDILLLIV